MRTTKPMRHWIALAENQTPVAEGLTNDSLTGRREAFYSGNLYEKKQATLDALDRLLGDQSTVKTEKVKALREVEAAAKRMADQIERHMRASA